jgi:2-polyprenyl-3-methyl-5-hydroxy-6-metoxy-1,4-benzoquinol methylase
MQRSLEPEIMDGPDIPADVKRKFHADLKLIHRFMDNGSMIIRHLHGERKVMDIGCGDGELLTLVREKTGAEVQGVDLVDQPEAKVPVIRADATRDRLPHADVAISSLVIHHLTEQQAIDLIRNVGRSCRRFVILDLVRHQFPLCLFTIFLCPFLSHVGAADGRQSVRRAFTGPEMNALIQKALSGTGATFNQWVSRFAARQVIDINFEAD